MQVEQLCLRFLENTISVGAVEDSMRYAICSSTGDTYKREIHNVHQVFSSSRHLTYDLLV
jgi:hypothetical protein